MEGIHSDLWARFVTLPNQNRIWTLTVTNKLVRKPAEQGNAWIAYLLLSYHWICISRSVAQGFFLRVSQSFKDPAGDGPRLRGWCRPVDQESGHTEPVAAGLRLWPAGIWEELQATVSLRCHQGRGAVCGLHWAVEAVLGPGEDGSAGTQPGRLPGHLLCHPVPVQVSRVMSLIKQGVSHIQSLISVLWSNGMLGNVKNVVQFGSHKQQLTLGYCFCV